VACCYAQPLRAMTGGRSVKGVISFSRDPRTSGSVTSILQRGVISILRLHVKAAEHGF
jgi:hypothetical protein